MMQINVSLVKQKKKNKCILKISRYISYMSEKQIVVYLQSIIQ